MLHGGQTIPNRDLESRVHDSCVVWSGSTAPTNIAQVTLLTLALRSPLLLHVHIRPPQSPSSWQDPLTRCHFSKECAWSGAIWPLQYDLAGLCSAQWGVTVSLFEYILVILIFTCWVCTLLPSFNTPKYAHVLKTSYAGTNVFSYKPELNPSRPRYNPRWHSAEHKTLSFVYKLVEENV